jgi:hypothetical protein
VTRPCAFCGAEFTVSPGVGERHKFCNVKCARKAAPSYNAGRQNPWTERECLNCGTVFQRAEKNGGARRHCSDACKREAASKRVYPIRRYKLAARYGITLEQLDAMQAEQDGRCAICSRILDGKGLEASAPQVDHDHATGKVRAILCRPCNTALGMFRDNPELVDQAAAYLRSWSALHAVS